MGTKKRNRHVGKKMIAGALALSMCLSSFQSGGSIKSIVHAAEATESDVICEWDFDSDTENWEYAASWGGEACSDKTISYDDGKLKMNMAFHKENNWDKAVIVQQQFSGATLNGAEKITFDFYCEPAAVTGSGLAVKAMLQVDGGKEWTDVTISDGDTKDITIADAKEGSGLMRTTLSYTLSDTTGDQREIKQLALEVAGKNNSYSGPVYFDNIRITKSPASGGSTEVKTEVIHTWDFEDKTVQEWAGSGWTSDSMKDALTTMAADTGKLGLTVGFDKGDSWCKAGIEQNNFSGINFDGAEKITFDFYYEKAKLQTGDLAIQAYVYNTESEEVIPKGKDIAYITNASQPNNGIEDGEFIKTTVST